MARSVSCGQNEVRPTAEYLTLQRFSSAAVGLQSPSRVLLPCAILSYWRLGPKCRRCLQTRLYCTSLL